MNFINPKTDFGFKKIFAWNGCQHKSFNTIAIKISAALLI